MGIKKQKTKKKDIKKQKQKKKKKKKKEMPCKKIKGAEIGEWTQDYEAAVKLAEEKNASILMNFTGSDWCGWCKLMDRNVFHHADFPPLAKLLNIVMIYIDFPSDQSLVPKE